MDNSSGLILVKSGSSAQTDLSPDHETRSLGRDRSGAPLWGERYSMGASAISAKTKLCPELVPADDWIILTAAHPTNETIFEVISETDRCRTLPRNGGLHTWHWSQHLNDVLGVVLEQSTLTGMSALTRRKSRVFGAAGIAKTNSSPSSLLTRGSRQKLRRSPNGSLRACWSDR